MKLKNFREEIRDELMRSSTEYCCYCVEPKRGKYVCCGEVDFVRFVDLDTDTQNDIIQNEIDEYEAWSDQQ